MNKTDLITESEKELKKGIDFCEKYDYQTAISCFTEAIRLDPKNALAYISRGNAYDYLEKYDEAIRDYTEAKKIDPEIEKRCKL